MPKPQSDNPKLFKFNSNYFMKLHKLTISGYKRIQSATVLIGDATFLIGSNNSGKSSALKAIEHLLSANKQIPFTEYHSITDPDTNERKTSSGRIVLEAEFRNVPTESAKWRGFKGRVFNYHPTESGETGLGITYRKTFELGKDVVVAIKSKKRTLKPVYADAKSPRELINLGADQNAVSSVFEDLDKKITQQNNSKLNEIDELWDIGTEESWFHNPGGIPGVVLSRLPRYIIIPAETGSEEINTSSGVLQKTLAELFEDVREASPNYRSAQASLNELAKEMDPSASQSEFGKMLRELNTVIQNVFPESQIHAKADLSDPNKSLRPSFSIELQSNIKTPVEQQGAGIIRSAVFGVLRFRQRWLSEREDTNGKRSLIIGFEEPEMYLHPGAANQMRDTIYDLSGPDCQIIATTHSPYIIDLSRKPKQILNRFSINNKGVCSESFNVTDEFMNLVSKERDYVKMLLKIDDQISRVFFTKQVIIIEGDTEEIVIRETMKCLPKQKRSELMASNEVVRARGKAAIIALARYLRAMSIPLTVIHDRDGGVEGAEKFNAPIASIVGWNNVIQIEDCIEDALAYPAPKSEKPYTAFMETQRWKEDWEAIPKKWREVFQRAFRLDSSDTVSLNCYKFDQRLER